MSKLLAENFAARSQQTVPNNVARSAAIEKADSRQVPIQIGPAWPLGPPAVTGGTYLPSEPERHTSQREQTVDKVF